MKKVGVLLLVLIPAICLAQPTQIAVDAELAVGVYVLEVLDDGTATLSRVTVGDPVLLYVDQAGKPIVVPSIVYPLGDTPTDPDPPTDPADIAALKAKVRVLTAAVQDPTKAATKSRIEEAYRATAEIPLDSKENYLIALEAIYTATVMQLDRVNQWVDWRNGVVGELNKLADDSIVAGLIAVADVLAEQPAVEPKVNGKVPGATPDQIGLYDRRLWALIKASDQFTSDEYANAVAVIRASR